MSRPALIDKLMQAGKWLLKPDLIPVDGTTLKRGAADISVAAEALTRSGGGLAVDARTGKLYVDFSLVPDDQMQAIVLAMVQQGGGLAVDQAGKLYVDFGSMPTEKFEAMLKSIRVPIWVNATKPFYVNQATGSDTLDAGRGESAAKPFKTIQACINYVTTNYNLNSHSVGIYIYPGIYEEQLRLGEYSRSTGYIALIDKEGEYSVTITSTNKSTITASGGLWYLRGLVLKNEVSAIDDGIAHFLSVLSASAGTVHLEGCDIQQEYTGKAPSNGNIYLRTIAAYGAGTTVQFDTTSKSRNNLRFHKGNASFMQTLFAERGGAIQCAASNNSQDYATVQCEGESDDFLYLGNANFNNVGGAYYLTIFAVEAAKAVTGRRFRLVTGSICSTGGKGPDFFPGDTAGTLEESTYCVYK